MTLLGLCVSVPAHAGLFSDDEARKQIKQLEAQFPAQVQSLEATIKQQTLSMLDLQTQIEALNSEIRKLRGQNEELAHGLQEAEKRQKDFYVDLDTRLRHFETAEESAKEAAKQAALNPQPVPVVAVPPVPSVSSDPNDPVLENRAIESAYNVFKSGNQADASKALREFIKKYPGSVHVPNATFWLGEAQYALKEYKGALSTFQGLLKDYPRAPKVADTYLNVAECNRVLKQRDEMKKTLKQLIAKYPDSEAAAKAKKLLSAK